MLTHLAPPWLGKYFLLSVRKFAGTQLKTKWAFVGAQKLPCLFHWCVQINVGPETASCHPQMSRRDHTKVKNSI